MNNRRHKIFKLELARQIFAFTYTHTFVDKNKYCAGTIFDDLNDLGKFSFVYSDSYGITWNISIHIGDKLISCKINGSDSWYSELNKLHTKEIQLSDIHNGKGWNFDTYTKFQLFFWLKSLETWTSKYWDSRAHDLTLSKILKRSKL